MQKFVLAVSLLVVLVASVQQNCIVLDKHHVHWKIERELIHFDVKAADGAKGWAAIGVGPNAYGMAGMNQVMTYFKNSKTFINEYYSESLMGQPTLYRDPLMRNAASVVNGEGFHFRFARPLSGTNQGYFHIKNETVKIAVALNWDTVPENADDWFVHSAVETKAVNLFSRYSEC